MADGGRRQGAGGEWWQAAVLANKWKSPPDGAPRVTMHCQPQPRSLSVFPRPLPRRSAARFSRSRV
eukprot:801468-Rhodomonas_salina.1